MRAKRRPASLVAPGPAGYDKAMHDALPQNDAEAEGPGLGWELWRQGDDGNEVLISKGHSRAEAERLCAMLEARGHKQLYWIRPGRP